MSTTQTHNIKYPDFINNVYKKSYEFIKKEKLVTEKLRQEINNNLLNFKDLDRKELKNIFEQTLKNHEKWDNFIDRLEKAEININRLKKAEININNLKTRIIEMIQLELNFYILRMNLITNLMYKEIYKNNFLNVKEIHNMYINNNPKLSEEIIPGIKRNSDKIIEISKNLQNLENKIPDIYKINKITRTNLIEELTKITRLETNIKNINERISRNIPGRKELWSVIATSIGLVTITLLILNSRIDSKAEHHKKINESHMNNIKQKIEDIKNLNKEQYEFLKENIEDIKKKQ